jgi:hypothetical protein
MASYSGPKCWCADPTLVRRPGHYALTAKGGVDAKKPLREAAAGRWEVVTVRDLATFDELPEPNVTLTPGGEQ